MKNSNREGFFSKVEKLDSTDIMLKFKPKEIFRREIFFNWKKRYTPDLYVIGDSSKRFIYILASWPNLQHDAQIFVSTSIHCNPRQYFSPKEYLLRDAVYSNISCFIGPYKSPYIKNNSNRKCNQKLFSV